MSHVQELKEKSYLKVQTDVDQQIGRVGNGVKKHRIEVGAG